MRFGIRSDQLVSVGILNDINAIVSFSFSSVLLAVLQEGKSPQGKILDLGPPKVLLQGRDR